MRKLAVGTLLGRVHEFLKVYLPNHRHLSPNTIRAYSKSLDLLLDFVKNEKHVQLIDVTFDMLTADMILAFLDYLEVTTYCSISTRNQRLAAIRAFIKYAATRDIAVAANLKELKAVPTKKTANVKLIEYMSEAAVAAILVEPDANTQKGFRDRTLLIMMYETAARVQEIADIKLSDFRWGKKPTVTLHGKGRKDRTVPISEKAAKHLKLYLDTFHPMPRNNGQYLFYTVIHGTTRSITVRRIRDIVKEHSASARKKCNEIPDNTFPHIFRHSRAMHLYQNGMDLTLIAQWLGHVHLDTTQIYAHADSEHKRVAIEKATSTTNPINAKMSTPRFTISDDDMLRQLAGLI